MKIAVISDTHCGIRNSSEIFMDYQEKFYRDVFFPYLEEHGIKKILHLGDYYENRTSINFKALHHNRRIFLRRLRDFGIHMDIIPGNHDCYFKNTNRLNALKELLGHYMSEIRIIEEPTVVDYDGCKLALLPWINNENEQETRDFIQNCKADICGAHLELNGFDMQLGIPCTDGMEPGLFSKFETVLSGHFHTKSQQGNIHYLGSQMEFFWSDVNDRKYFHIFDTDTRELTAVENPITIFEKIHYDDTGKTPWAVSSPVTKDMRYLDEKFVKVVVINKSKPQVFETFIDKINNRNIHGLQIAENFQDFAGAQVDDENISIESTDKLLYTYIDAVDTDLDKDRIKNKVHELMIEAQSLEIV
jgi:DNA repair exonuclease SbcCD nuclease subunit